MRHMTDDEMQAYLDVGASSLDRVFDKHLVECPECRQEIEYYRMLYTQLSEPDTAEGPSPNFVNRTSERLIVEFNSLKWRTAWNSVGISIATLVSLLFSFVFLGTLEPIKSSLAIVYRTTVTLFTTIGHFHDNANNGDETGAEILLFALMIIMSIAIADFCLKRFRGKKICI